MKRPDPLATVYSVTVAPPPIRPYRPLDCAFADGWHSAARGESLPPDAGGDFRRGYIQSKRAGKWLKRAGVR